MEGFRGFEFELAPDLRGFARDRLIVQLKLPQTCTRGVVTVREQLK